MKYNKYKNILTHADLKPEDFENFLLFFFSSKKKISLTVSVEQIKHTVGLG